MRSFMKYLIKCEKKKKDYILGRFKSHFNNKKYTFYKIKHVSYISCKSLTFYYGENKRHEK